MQFSEKKNMEFSSQTLISVIVFGVNSLGICTRKDVALECPKVMLNDFEGTQIS